MMICAAFWVSTLAFSGAPVVVTLLSSVAILSSYHVTYVYASFLQPQMLETFFVALFMVVLFVNSVFRYRSNLRRTISDCSHAFVRFALCLGIRAFAMFVLKGRFRTFTAAYSTEEINIYVSMVLALLMLVLGSLSKPTVPAVVGGLFVVRTVGELIDSDLLGFYGCTYIALLLDRLNVLLFTLPLFIYACRTAAFVAQYAQGIAHDVTRQKATLLQHNESTKHSRRVRLGHEWSHVVYFPNLLLQSCHASWARSKTN